MVQAGINWRVAQQGLISPEWMSLQYRNIISEHMKMTLGVACGKSITAGHNAGESYVLLV